MQKHKIDQLIEKVQEIVISKLRPEGPAKKLT